MRPVGRVSHKQPRQGGGRPPLTTNPRRRAATQPTQAAALHPAVTQRDGGEDVAELVPLEEAIAATVHDGDTVALEGFTHLIPVAAGHEIIRQGRRGLTL